VRKRWRAFPKHGGSLFRRTSSTRSGCGPYSVKAIFVKSHDGLRPASDEAVRVLARYRAGDEVLLEHKRGRSAGNHRRFFAFVSTTFDWQDVYDEIDIWRKVLEIAAGHFDAVIDKHGETHYWPRSIAWDELDEDEFRALFSKVVNAYLGRFGAGLNDAQINLVVGF